MQEKSGSSQASASAAKAFAHETPLEQALELREYRSALRALGYRTVESFVGAARASNRELSAYLGKDVDQLIGTLPESARSRMNSFSLPPRFPMGAMLGRIPRPAAAFRFSLPPAGPPQGDVNWIVEMPGVRNQGYRGTCVAHAALAVVEHYAGTQSQYQDMSEQFLYANCKDNDGDPTHPGTYLAIAMPLLERDGCCLEATWAYNPNPTAGNEGQGPATAAARAEALQYRVTPFHQLAPNAVQDLKNELLRHRCVAFDIPVFNSWYQNPEVTRTGEIVLPIPGEKPIDGHAMCLVGYIDLPGETELGEGRFLLRNSWGNNWGTECSYGIGYGTIPYAYIARYGEEAYSIY